MSQPTKATIAAVLGVSGPALRQMQRRHGIADDVLGKPDEFAAAIERAGITRGPIFRALSDPRQRESITSTLNALIQ